MRRWLRIHQGPAVKTNNSIWRTRLGAKSTPNRSRIAFKHKHKCVTFCNAETSTLDFLRRAPKSSARCIAPRILAVDIQTEPFESRTCHFHQEANPPPPKKKLILIKLTGSSNQTAADSNHTSCQLINPVESNRRDDKAGELAPNGFMRHSCFFLKSIQNN